MHRRVPLLRALAVAAAALAGAAGCGAEDGGRDAVEAMVLETCAPGGESRADPVCRCAFDAILDELGPDGLTRLDERLRTDPTALPPELREAILDCAFERVDPSPPTSAATSTTQAEEDEGEDGALG